MESLQVELVICLDRHEAHEILIHGARAVVLRSKRDRLAMGA
jgi:hypothetical protein